MSAMGYKVTTKDEVTDAAVAVCTNDADESIVYCTVKVHQSNGMERNAVIIETGEDVDFTAVSVDDYGNGYWRDDVGRALSAALALHYARKDGVVTTREATREDYVDVVFDGPPSHESGRFVEVEDRDGKSVGVGDWIERPDGHWALRIPRAKP